MRGHKRFKDRSWRLIVDAGKDPMTGKRRQIFRTVRAPNTRGGAQAADVELARLIVEVTSGETAPSAQITVGELLVRWVEHRRRAWEARPDTLITRNNLAASTGNAGEPAEAGRLFAELVPDRIRVLGADHPDTLITRSNLAVWTGEAGEPAEARRLFAELLPDCIRVLGADHPDTLITRNNLAPG
jgi:hypothetical protein